MKRFFFLAVIITAAFTTAAKADRLQYLQGLNNPDYHRIESKTLERPFHIFVRLPEGYEETKRRYPTVYLLDGGTTFPLLASFYALMSIDEPMPDAIIVGISYGGANIENGNYRSTDYTAAAPDRDYWGGAANYQKFLESELLALIEDNYRSDAKRRIIYGQSLGGQFVLFTALTKPDLFWGHIASNPALHRNLSYFLEAPEIGSSTSSKLFVSSGTKDAERFKIPALAWIKHWAGKPKTPWQLKIVHLENETHAAAAPNSFREGMRWLFEAQLSEAE